MNHLGRALTEYADPPVKVLFVYNCNPAATVPDQRRVLRGLEREDLFTVVFEQVMTDTALYADVVLPATTFLEGYDFAKGVRADQPGPRRAGRRRRRRSRARTPTCSASCARGSACSATDEPTGELDLLRPRARCAARDDRRRSSRRRAPGAAVRPRAGSVRRRLPEHAGSEGRPVPRRARTQRAARACIASSPIPATERYPLALISPASERTISSTLGELPRPDVKLPMHPGRCGGARAGGRRSGARLQRSRRGALPARAWRRRSGPAPSACPKGCGGAARATASPARRSCRTRSPISAAARASTTRACRSRRCLGVNRVIG